MNINRKVVVLIWVIASFFISCSETKEKEIVLYPSLSVDAYLIVYKDKSIVIQECSKKSEKGNKWYLSQNHGEYYLTYHGKKYLFLSNKREWDTIFQEKDDMPIHTITKKMNDSLYVSSFNQIVIYEGMILEIVYDKSYVIKQVRRQALWIDYTPTKMKAIEYIPFLYENSKRKECME